MFPYEPMLAALCLGLLIFASSLFIVAGLEAVAKAIRDRKGCPVDGASVAAARIDWKARAEALEARVANDNLHAEVLTERLSEQLQQTKELMERAEAQPDAIQGLVDALRDTKCHNCRMRIGIDSQVKGCLVCEDARASLKAWEEAKAK